MRIKAIIFVHLLLVFIATSVTAAVMPQVSTGEKHTVGLKSDGTVVAVGNNESGQCNVGGWSDITQISAGRYHTVGLKSDGTVVAVGNSGLGQCDVDSWSGIIQVSAGGYHTIGLKSDGTVVAVGDNGSGQRNVDSWSSIIQVSAGNLHTVGLKSDGTVEAVGRNLENQLNVGGWSDITQVSGGFYHTVGLKTDGTAVAVGKNDYGECDLSGWSGITQVSAGSYLNVGLKSDGTVVAEGRNDDGQCDVNGWSGITQVSAGSSHTVGLRTDGRAVAVGSNSDRQCNMVRFCLHDFTAPQLSAGGDCTVGLKSDGTVVAVGDNATYGQCNVSGWSGITQVSAGGDHTLGLKSDGTVVAVGRNIPDGQCDVSGWSGIIQVSAGDSHSVGLKSDGTVVAVGNTVSGRCNVSGWSGIIQVSAGRLHTVGLKSDGTVVAVGDNATYGQCNVSGWSGIVQVSAGSEHTVGLKSDGTVVAVGRNIPFGQCDVSGWSDIVQVSAGGQRTIGLKSDGTVVVVGDIADGSVSSWSGIVQVSAGRQHLVGLKSNGTVFAVGNNISGECDVDSWNIIRRIFSGHVTLGGAGFKDVVISSFPSNPVTNDSGYYVAYADSGWSGTATPTRAGYTFTPANRNYSNVTAHQFEQDYSAIITPVLAVTSPNGGEIWEAGSAQNITWSSAGTVGDVKIDYSSDSGSSWSAVTPQTSNDGSYPWTVPNSHSATCLVRVSETDGSPSDSSDSVFTIIALPAITLVSPNGGETWEVGSVQNITWSYTGSVGNVKIDYSTDNGSSWSAVTAQTSNDGSYPWTVPNSPSTTCLVRVSEEDGSPSMTSNAVFSIVSIAAPLITLSRTSLNFGARTTGEKTSDQFCTIINTGGGSLDWSITDNKGWLSCSPASGVGDGKIGVSVDPTGLSSGTYTGQVTVSSTTASNAPQYLNVSFRVYSVGEETTPFGVFDTPPSGATVSGNIPVTGWAVDDIEVSKVEIKRSPHPDDPSAAIGPDGLVFVGKAYFVNDARPDVEQVYSGYPLAYRAGWGCMVLTNFLPNQGNGDFTLHAFAYDIAGNKTDLGQKLIHCDNANRIKPFGSIDTPRLGEVISGNSFINFAWALTPMPKMIPTDGSTLWVYVDGVPLGHPVYNQYRVDIATKFPGYANSNGAVGFYVLDTAQYENGRHLLAWSMADDQGAGDGMSRYFEIQNLGSTIASLRKRPYLSLTEDPAGHLRISARLKERGYGRKAGSGRNILPLNAPRGYSEHERPLVINIEELERIVIEFEGGSSYIGWGADETIRLPIGSTLDQTNGIFYWSPGPGFLGRYTLNFAVTDGRLRSKPARIVVNIIPKRY